MSRMSSTKDLSFSGKDEIEYESFSSGAVVIPERNERLHEWLKAHDIETMHRKFKQHPKQKLNHRELRALLEEHEIQFTDVEYHRLFLKINQNHDMICDWNEFVSYLIFGFQEDDNSTSKVALILPISILPVVKKSEHRSAVVCSSLLQTDFRFIAAVLDQTDTHIVDDMHAMGMWLTASREGQIRFWSTHLEPIRAAASESFHLKMPTWILAMQTLSDVSVVVTSSTERELRFHETIASTFTLRMVMRSMPIAVNVMSYAFHPNQKVLSKLVLGDFAGNVHIIEFPTFLRGPFQSKPGSALIVVFWSDVVKGKVPKLTVKEYPNIHSEMIRSLYFSIRMNSVLVAAEYRNTKKYRGKCPGLIMISGEDRVTYRVPMGVTTFYCDEKHHVIVTGGPDFFVRIWDVYIPANPSGILTGHNAGIVYVFVQTEEQKVYSIDYHKIIKVWHLSEHTLLQTYSNIVNLISHSETDLAYNYHPFSRDLLIAGRKLIKLSCCPRVRVELTDGNTHPSPVTVVLYNHLFRNVVTCGLDSNIIVWDPWTGRRKLIIKNCHTKTVYGEIIDIEITAACFDPLGQFLLTGARDGSLKIWNYNNGFCMRNMSIKPEHEVTSVIWVVERILAVGWDKIVTEFNDAEGSEYSDAKRWPKFHNEDITCADVKLGEGVVTATYSGEIIFWKLETGQPYRRYNVARPKDFIELKQSNEDEEVETQESFHVTASRYVRKSISDSIRVLEQKWRVHQDLRASIYQDDFFDEEEQDVVEQRKRRQRLPQSVQSVLFLQTRPMTKEHGSVLVSLDTGKIQCYSHHQHGGFLGGFNCIHKTGDCALTMASDRKNRYLFTGSAFGYIKVWHIENFCVPEAEKKHISMPLMRLQFIFLRRERFLTRAKRMVRRQPNPMLLSSFKGHLKAVNSIVYINLPKILLTASHDCSCRLWTLGGRYLGTLGSPLPWLKLSPFESSEEPGKVYRLPPEIQKVASSTTMKVISGVQECRFIDSGDVLEGGQEDDAVRLYTRPLPDPILGRHFALPGKAATEQRVELDSSQSYVPVFSHLKVHETDEIVRPRTPPAIKRIAKEEYMDFYLPPKGGDTPEDIELVAPVEKKRGAGDEQNDDEEIGSSDLSNWTNNNLKQ